MISGIRLPTRIRFLSSAEYILLTDVFENTLPYRVRILVTDCGGLSGRAFTIPSSLVSTILGLNLADFFASAVMGYLGSAVNLGYLMNVGKDYYALETAAVDTLIHEGTHVWQGHNSRLAMTYVFNSIYYQHKLGSAAYSYTAGGPWSSYAAEQQAKIVEDWYHAGAKSDHYLFWYIRDHIRKRDA